MIIRKSPFKLCTFDVTNTLLKFKISVGDQYSKVGHMFGVYREPDKITTAFRHHWKVMNTDHPNFGRKSGMTSRDWWTEMVRRTFLVGSPAVSGNQLKLITNYLYELYATEACWKVVDGTEDVLKLLNENNIIVGVISNFDERLDSVLCSTGLKSYFKFVIASYFADEAKPSSKIFNQALMLNPRILCSDALHIGDDVKLDYMAAKEAGWSSLLMKGSKMTSEDLKCVEQNDIVQNLSDLKNHIFYS